MTGFPYHLISFQTTPFIVPLAESLFKLFFKIFNKCSFFRGIASAFKRFMIITIEMTVFLLYFKHDEENYCNRFRWNTITPR